MSGKRIAKTIYIEERQNKAINAICKKYNRSISAVICDALDKALGQNQDEVSELAAEMKRLRTDLYKHRERTGEDMLLLTELVLSFARHYMTTTPPIPESERAVADAQGKAEFERFLEAFQQSLISDGAVSQGLFSDEE